MRRPFEPEAAGSSPLAALFLSPAASEGRKVFERERCTECHGADLSGTSSAPTLVGVGQKYDTGTLRSILRQQPSDSMSDGGMQPVDIKEEDLTAMITFLESEK